MNKEIKTKWLEALRSGEYQQTTEVLKDSKGFCCLGVLCDIHSKITGETDWEIVNGGNKYYEEFRCAPRTVVKWSGIEDCNPDVKLDNHYWNIAELNDGGRSFKEIADIIEQQM